LNYKGKRRRVLPQKIQSGAGTNEGMEQKLEILENFILSKGEMLSHVPKLETVNAVERGEILRLGITGHVAV
jgi:hypothetical protein